MADYGNFRVKNGLDVGIGASIIATSSDKNIGIGSALPQYKLDVAGDINFTGSLYQNGTAFSGGGGGSGIGTQWITTSTGIHTFGKVGIGTVPEEKLDVVGNGRFTGSLTASQFIGDGSGLTGIVATGSGIVIKDDGSTVGTASTINFGTNLNVSLSSGTATVDVAGIVSSITAGSGISIDQSTGNVTITSTGGGGGIGTAGGDGANIRSISGAHLVSYASQSDFANSALSISGVSTYRQVGILTGSASTNLNDNFGTSLATSADGKTIVIGAYQDEVSGTSDNGVVYVFDRTGNSFNQVGILTGSRAGDTSDQFGYSVAVSADGKTIIAGSPFDEGSGAANSSGTAYVFDRVGNTFTQVGILTGLYASTAGDNFGFSVATSADGKTIAVGAYQDETGATSDIGVVYVFDRDGDTFTRVGSLTGSNATNSSDGFGNSLVVSADGKTIIVGAYQDETGGTSDTGVVYIFERQGNTFNQVASLTGSNSGAADQFGYSVAVSADGKKIIVGSPEDEITGHASGSGVVYVFDRKGSTVSQVGILTGLYSNAVTTGDNFGYSVATNADGNTIVVGALNDEYPLSNTSSGLVYVFNRQGDSFSTVGIITGYYSGATGDNFGNSVSVSADGKTIIVGAWNDEYPGTSSSSGSVYVFDEVKETYLYSGPTGNIGIGTSNPQSKLEVFGNSRVIGNLDFTGNISKNGTTLNILGINTVGTTTLNNLSITGVSTFSGISTFQSDAYVGGVLYANSFSVAGGTTFGNDIVTRNISASGVSTFSGISTFQSQIYVNGNINYTGDLLKNGQPLQIPVGIDTLGFSNFTHINASGIITATQLEGNGIGIRNAQGAYYSPYSSYSENSTTSYHLVGLSTYVQVGVFSGSNGPNRFASNITANVDGSIVYVSAESNVSSLRGHIYAYERVGIGTLKQIGIITGRNNYDGYGQVLECSADGKTVLISQKDYNEASAVYATGYVDVYEYNGSVFNKLFSDYNTTAYSYFGHSANITGDSKLVYIGAKGYSSNAGRLKVYERSGNTYEYLQELSLKDQYGNYFSSRYFATSSAVSYDGKTLYISSTHSSPNINNSGNGVVFVYHRKGLLYERHGNLPYISDSNQKLYGSKVVCSADGNIVAVSVPRDNVNGFTYNGTVYFYERSRTVPSDIRQTINPDNFIETFTLLGSISGTADNQEIGDELSMSYDGTICAIRSTINVNNHYNVLVCRINRLPFPSVSLVSRITTNSSDYYYHDGGSQYGGVISYGKSFKLTPDGRFLHIGIPNMPYETYSLNQKTGIVEVRKIQHSPTVYVDPSTGNVGIGTTNSAAAKLKVSGTVNATAFVGDGSGLTGIVASGSGIIIRDDGSLVGTAATLDFGTNIAVSPLSAGIVTITAAAGFNTLGETKFNRLFISGITTLSSASGSGLHISTNTFRVYDGLGTRYTNLQAPSNSSYGGSDAIVTLPSKTGELIVGNTSGSISQNINSTGIITATTFFSPGTTVSGMLTATKVSVAQSVTASSFYGDGSTLTGIVATGSGVEVRDDGTVVGTASTLNFGTNLTVTFSGGTATIDGGSNSGVFNTLNVSGVASAGIFRGDGSDLRNISGTYLVPYSDKSKISDNSFGIVGVGTYAYVGVYSGGSPIREKFGSYVRTSADGSTVVVSASGFHNAGGISNPAVKILKRSGFGTSFDTIGIITAGPYRVAAHDDYYQFGSFGATDISSDGRIIVVGAGQHRFTNMNTKSGVVYVYEQIGIGSTSSLKTVGILTSPNNLANQYFGSAVALGNNGKTLYVGSVGYDSWKGRVYIYEYINDQFTNVGIVTGLYSEGAGDVYDFYSHFIACSADGKTLAVYSANDETPTGTESAGIIYVYERTQYKTNLVGIITDFGGLARYPFNDGYDKTQMCLSKNGDTIIFTHRNHPATFVYQRKKYQSNANSYELAASVAIETPGSVACSADGNLIFIGCNVASSPGQTVDGLVYVYRKQGGRLNLVDTIYNPSRGNYDHFGNTVACSADGTVLYVGSLYDEERGSTNEGVFYVFDQKQQQYVYTTDGGYIGIGSEIPNFKLDVTGDINFTGDLYQDGALFIGAGGGGGEESTHSVYSSHSESSNFALSIGKRSTHRQVGILTGTYQSNFDEYGKSISITPDGKTIIVGAPKDTKAGNIANAGLAYVYDDIGGSKFVEVGILTGTNNTPGMSQYNGISVKISADGLTAFVGSEDYGSGGAESGVLHIWNRDSKKTPFVKVGSISASDGTSDYFSRSLDASNDGGTVVIGAPNDEIDPALSGGTGIVFVYDKLAKGVYTQVGILTGSKATQPIDYFGTSVACNKNGKTIIVGAPNDENYWSGNYGDQTSETGLAYVFDRIGGDDRRYVEVGILTGSYLTNGDNFGYSVAVDAEGKTFFVGAFQDLVDTGIQKGSVYVFDRVGVGSTSIFKEVAVISGSNSGDADNFGRSLACTADGKTLAVGAPYDEFNSTDEGVVYIFNRQGNKFIQVGIVTNGTSAFQTDGDALGWCVDISDDGKRVVAGAPFYDIGGNNNKGAAAVFDVDINDEIYLYSGSTGNIGIGVTLPQYKLEVAGDINFTGSLYQNGTVFSGGGGGSIGAGGTWGVTSVGIHTLKNVGIGTTNPTSALTVSGDGFFTGVVTSTTFSGQVNQTSGVSTFISVLSSGIRITGVATATRGFSGNLTGNVNATGVSTFLNRVDVKNDDASPSRIDFYTETGGTRYTRLQSATHSSYSSNLTVTLPTVSGKLIVGDTATTISNNINSAGIITASSFSGKNNDLFTEWTLGASGTSDYTFTGPGFSGSELDPTLYLVRGKKYKFTNTMGAHPFRIQSTVNGSTGTQYNNGITNNDVSNGTLTWEVRFDAPSTLYYQCTSHGSMGGVIYILNEGTGGGGGGGGSQGIQGIQGISGAFVSQGIQGIQGVQGIQGSGTQGTQGISGAQGLDGSYAGQGIQGVQGIQGSSTQGTQGILGAQGLAGSYAGQGIQGVQGLAGSGGLSESLAIAYSIAL